MNLCKTGFALPPPTLPTRDSGSVIPIAALSFATGREGRPRAGGGHGRASLTSNPHLSLGGVGRCARSRPSGRTVAVNRDRVRNAFGREWLFSPAPLCGVRMLPPSRRGSLVKRTQIWAGLRSRQVGRGRSVGSVQGRCGRAGIVQRSWQRLFNTVLGS